MQKIINNLWFDKEAEEAATFYTSIFPDSKIGSTTRYTKAGFDIHGQPEGQVMTIEFELAGQPFVGLNGGPVFTFTPAVSFMVACETKEEVDALWKKLAEGGTALMELGEYPFSERYGWTTDKFGLSWQIMYTGSEAIKQKITPTLMFIGEAYGKAEEAMQFYTSLFENSSIGEITRYGERSEFDKAGTVMHANFYLEGQQFAAMDSGYDHKFTPNEAISFLITCKDQAEIDRYWDKLTEGGDPASQQCGWVKDKFGFSWQVTPSVLNEMIQDKDLEKVERVTNAFMKMKKMDIAELEKAFEG